MSNQGLFTKLIHGAVNFSDSRGSISVLYESNTTVLKRSSSKKGVFRGLHRQISPSEQTKIIRIISGKILDFVSDPEEADEIIWYTELSSKDDWVKIDLCDGKYDESLEQSYRVDGIISEVLGLKPIYLSEKDSKGIKFGKSVRPL